MVMACVLACVAAPVAAQDVVPKAELGAGYQFIRGQQDNLKKGGFVDLAVNGNKLVGIVMQLDLNSRGIAESTSLAGVNLSATGSHRVIHAMGGLRFNNRTDKVAKAFAHVLAGIQHQTMNVTATGTGLGQSASQNVSESMNNFVVQAGGGVNFMLGGGGVGLRIGGDYILGKGDSAPNLIRLTAGIAVPLGKK
jgi:hypothetical protein